MRLPTFILYVFVVFSLSAIVCVYGGVGLTKTSESAFDIQCRDLRIIVKPALGLTTTEIHDLIMCLGVKVAACTVGVVKLEKK